MCLMNDDKFVVLKDLILFIIVEITSHEFYLSISMGNPEINSQLKLFANWSLYFFLIRKYFGNLVLISHHSIVSRNDKIDVSTNSTLLRNVLVP